jgi:hypothetical protein
MMMLNEASNEEISLSFIMQSYYMLSTDLERWIPDTKRNGKQTRNYRRGLFETSV